MNKNQTTGLLLILLILLGWSWYTAPSKEEMAKFKATQDSIALVKTQEETPTLKTASGNINQTSQTNRPEMPVVNKQLPDSLRSIAYKTTYGAFYNHAAGDEETSVLENDLIKIEFTNKGGRIKDVWLKEYYKITLDENKDDLKLPLHLLEDVKNKFDYQLPIIGVPNGILSSGNLYFDSNKSGSTISFKIKTDNGGYFEQIYTLNPNSYELDYNVKFVGLEQVLKPNTKMVNLHWENYLDKLEKNSSYEQRYSTVYFKSKNDDYDYASMTSDDIEEIDEGSVEWVSNSNQFFNTSIISKDTPFGHGRFETNNLKESRTDPIGEDLKLLKTDIEVPVSSDFAMNMYIGPNEFEVLKEYGNGLEQVVPFGASIFGSINRWVIRPIFNFLGRYIGSKGLVILALIFLIKMVLYPLMFKMLHSQAKMGVLKPFIEDIKKKNKDDSQAQQVETMKLYREYGVSPFGGCMPMLLQMPIWYAMFRFFPASITFRQEPFLWATDLSSYDVFWKLPIDIPMYGSHVSLFTLLWAVTTIIYTYYNTKHMDMSANPTMKYIQYFMPVTFLVFFNQFASGLTVYMFMSNLINIAQTVLTKKFVFDDEKILAELNAKKALPKKKKGKFAKRFEEAMKQSQDLKAKQDAAKKKK